MELLIISALLAVACFIIMLKALITEDYLVLDAETGKTKTLSLYSERKKTFLIASLISFVMFSWHIKGYFVTLRFENVLDISLPMIKEFAIAFILSTVYPAKSIVIVAAIVSMLVESKHKKTAKAKGMIVYKSLPIKVHKQWFKYAGCAIAAVSGAFIALAIKLKFTTLWIAFTVFVYCWVAGTWFLLFGLRSTDEFVSNLVQENIFPKDI